MTRRLVWVVLVAVSLGAPKAGAEPMTTIQNPLMQRDISGLVDVGAFMAMTSRETGGLVLMSANGRFLVRGPVVDVWSGAEIADLDAMRHAVTHVDLVGMGDVVPMLEPITLGREGLDPVVVFVDPSCPVCEALLQQLQGLTGRHRFHVIPIAVVSSASQEAVQRLACAADESARIAALFDGSHALGPIGADCGVEVMMRRLVVARLLEIRGVPFLIRSDGRMHAGLPDDLDSWLGGEG